MCIRIRIRILSYKDEPIVSVTMWDVARRAGVSQSTVSRVLNKNKGISPDVVRRVEDAVRELGYRPNSIARGLRGVRMHLIGVIIPDQTDGFFMNLLRGLEDIVQPAGYNLLVGTTRWKPEMESYYTDVLLQHRVDALVIAPGPENPELRRELASTDIPIIAVNEIIIGLETDFVVHDNFQGAYSLVEHLAGLGHRRIAFLAGKSNMINARERLAGYKRALEEFNIPYHPELVLPSRFSVKGGIEATRRILALPDRPTAIIAGNGSSGVGALFALKEAGITIPDEISVALFRDLEYAGLLNPPVTSLKDASYEIGAAAGRLVLRRLKQKKGNGLHRVTLKPELIIRESTGPVPTGFVAQVQS